MTAIIGLGMIYSWIHGSIIVGKKVKDLTQYEKVLLIVAVVSMAFYVVGTINQ